MQAFSEMNSGPRPNTAMPNAVDISHQYQRIGVDMVRTHYFYGYCDISMIFPNLTADPFDATNYNFTVSDQYIKDIIDVGAEVFYRLGESASADDALRKPPQNMSRWAEVL